MPTKADAERIALTLNKMLREKFDADVVFGGSLGLFLNGIVLDRDFHDVDVRVLNVDPKVVRKEGVEYEIPIHFLGNTTVPLEYKEVDVQGEKILVYTPETILNCKKYTIQFNETRRIKNEFTERKNEKDRKDLAFIKEKYGIG